MLNEEERKFAEEHAGIILGYLWKNGFDVDIYYGAAAEGYLNGVKSYLRKEDLKKDYSAAFILWQSIRWEVSKEYKKEKKYENAMRNSVDIDEIEDQRVYRKNIEDVVDRLLVEEILSKLTEQERKIIKYKIIEYKNREISERMSISSSTIKNRLKSTREKVRKM